MQQKNFERKKELLDAAVEEFGINGYEKASLNNILKAAGISKGTFYYHFKNKEELYIYLLTSFGEEKMKFFESRINKEFFNQDLFTMLEKLIEYGLEFATNNPQIQKFSESYMKEKDSKIFHKIIEHFGDDRMSFLDTFIDNAYQKSELRKDISITFQKNIISYLLAHVVEIADILKVEDFKEAGMSLIKFIRNGLEGPSIKK